MIKSYHLFSAFYVWQIMLMPTQYQLSRPSLYNSVHLSGSNVLTQTLAKCGPVMVLPNEIQLGVRRLESGNNFSLCKKEQFCHKRHIGLAKKLV